MIFENRAHSIVSEVMNIKPTKLKISDVLLHEYAMCSVRKFINSLAFV